MYHFTQHWPPSSVHHLSIDPHIHTNHPYRNFFLKEIKSGWFCLSSFVNSISGVAVLGMCSIVLEVCILFPTSLVVKAARREYCNLKVGLVRTLERGLTSGRKTP
jgi:hypothetical protein